MAEKTNFIEKAKGAINKLPFNNLAGKVPALVKVAGYANYAFCALVVVLLVILIAPSSSKVPSYLIVEGTEVIGYMPNGVPAKIKIPNGITVISEEAFAGFKTLESVSFPKTLTEIGDKAFANCTSLKTLTIPEGVTKIGTASFSGCTALTKVSLSDTVKTISKQAFYACTSLSDVTIPKTVNLIGQNAFQKCSSLKELPFEDAKSLWYERLVGGYEGEYGTMDDPIRNAEKLTAYQTGFIFKPKPKTQDADK